MDKVCPNCLLTFRCRVDKIEVCNCSKLNLATGVREHIKNTYGNCLCFDCLKMINDKFAVLSVDKTEELNG